MQIFMMLAFLALLALAAEKFECGTSPEMTIQDRIKSCAPASDNQKIANGFPWSLVARTVYEHRVWGEVWRDDTTGKLWSHPLWRPYNFWQAVHLGPNGEVLKQRACDSKDGIDSRAGLMSLNFTLPSAADFLEAEEHGIRQIQEKMKHNRFWTSELSSRFSKMAVFYSGRTGRIAAQDKIYGDAVMCVHK